MRTRPQAMSFDYGWVIQGGRTWLLFTSTAQSKRSSAACYLGGKSSFAFSSLSLQNPTKMESCIRVMIPITTSSIAAAESPCAPSSLPVGLHRTRIGQVRAVQTRLKKRESCRPGFYFVKSKFYLYQSEMCKCT